MPFGPFLSLLGKAGMGFSATLPIALGEHTCYYRYMRIANCAGSIPHRFVAAPLVDAL